jgi:hypothetical protein
VSEGVGVNEVVKEGGERVRCLKFCWREVRVRLLSLSSGVRGEERVESEEGIGSMCMGRAGIGSMCNGNGDRLCSMGGVNGSSVVTVIGTGTCCASWRVRLQRC